MKYLLLVVLSVSLVEGTKKKGVGLFMGNYHCNDTQALTDITWCNKLKVIKKKGVGLFMGNYHCNDTQALTDITWWYNWEPWYVETQKQGCDPPRGEFATMVQWKMNDQHISLPPESHYILGFNEPNIYKSVHKPNTTPQVAASHWQHIQANRHGKLLVSPAPARCPKGLTPGCKQLPMDWLDEFFSICHNCSVEHIAVHTYTCDVEDDLRYLETIHKRYNKKIWVTEFACPHSGNLNHIESYMRGIVPRLEKAPFVFRYAWFQARIPVGDNFIHKQNALLHADSSKLTPLGRLYNSLH